MPPVPARRRPRRNDRGVSGPFEEIGRAKVNLALHVVGRRADGYHLLDTLVVFPDIGDVLTAEVADDLFLAVDGPEAEALRTTAPDDNLVMRAARGLRSIAGSGAGARLTLTKQLPVASGIGGGSADAAAAIRLLCRLWGIDPASDAVASVARGLGADVPMCLAQRALRASGIGQDLVLLPEPPTLGILLVNPRVPVATPAVFKALERRDHPALAVVPDRSEAYLDAIVAGRNDLQAAAVAVAPEIRAVLSALARMDDVITVRMSGSGATCFGLFPDRSAAERAAALLAAVQPRWWIAPAAIG